MLGALLSNNRVREQCLNLDQEHFADPEYARAFTRITERIDEGGRVDAVSLRGEFEGDLIANLLGSMVGLQISEYVLAIKDCAARRQLIEIAEHMAAQAFAGGLTTETAINAAARIDAIALGSCPISGIMLGDAVTQALAALKDAQEHSGLAGLSSGYHCIDERLGGFEDDTLTIIAARPGMGKTGLGCNIAIKMARAGVPVIMFSLEMSRMQLARRALASATGVPVIAIKRGSVNVKNTGDLVGAGKSLLGLPLWIEDAAGVPASVIASRTRAWRRKHAGPAMMMVDHLHIVRPEDGDIRSGATYAVGEVSGALKRISKACGMPVVALAQLNRGVEGRDDKRPGLADLRQSGNIEQDADSIAFIYREEYYLGNEPIRKPAESEGAHNSRRATWAEDKQRVSGDADLIWAKVRDGQPGTDKLKFDGPTTTFSEVP